MPVSDGGGASEPRAGAEPDVEVLEVPDVLDVLGGAVVEVVVLGGGLGPIGISWAWA
jgi:hypothetical protein